MDLESLEGTGEVSEQEFRRLFETRIGGLLPRSLTVLEVLGPKHSFSVANVIHLGLQKGIVEGIVEGLEAWCEVASKAPDEATAYVDTRQFFDTMYSQYFMAAGDTIGGLGPFQRIERDGNSFLVFDS